MAEVSSGIETPSVTAATPTIDVNGNCTHHPIIKLRRYNKSTQQWKTILKTCPLCSVRGTTPPRRCARRRRSDKLGSTEISDTMSSCDKDKDAKIQHRSSIISPKSTSISQSVSVRSDVLPPHDKNNQDKLNFTQYKPVEEDDSLSPLESELSLCKQTSNLSITDTCDVTEASTCSGSTTSFHGSSSSSMGIWRYDSIESSGSGGSSRSLGDEGKDLQQEIVVSPLGMPNASVVCQPCNIPPPPIAPPKTESVRRGRARAANNSMHSIPPPPPRTARNSYRRSSTGTSSSSSSSQNRRGSINTDTPPLSPRRSSYPSQLRQSSLKGGGEVVVCGMSYTNPTTNQKGSYTGQVIFKGGVQVPHGIGTLKYTNVNLGKVEGQWLDGALVDSVEQGRERSRRPFPPPPPKSRGAPPSAHSTQDFNMPSLTASSNSGMNDNSSWCQPCDDSTSSTPPSPPSYSPRSSHTGSQELQFCSPCSPSPQVEQTVPLERGGKPRVSLSPRVEVALPLHFKQQKKPRDLFSSYLTQEQEEEDDVGASSSEESDNSLRTYQTRSSKGSKRSGSYPLSPDVSYRSARSTGTSRSKRSSYSARESKAAIDIIRTKQF